MKDYKWKKGLAFIALCALGGFIIGGGLKMLMNVSELSSIKTVFMQLSPSLFYVATVCGIIGLLGYFYFNNLLKKDDYSNDEDSLFDRHENKMSVIMSFSTLCAVINFTAFGVNLALDLSSIYFLLFILNVILSFLGEIANISLIKKIRPELNADPLNLQFSKEYFDQLDECEKITTGKASFKTMTAMVPVYVITFLISWLLIMTLDISPIICLPIGVLWFMQTVLLTYHSFKQK